MNRFMYLCLDVHIVDAAPNRLSSLHKVISQLRDVELGTIKHV